MPLHSAEAGARRGDAARRGNIMRMTRRITESTAEPRYGLESQLHAPRSGELSLRQMEVAPIRVGDSECRHRGRFGLRVPGRAAAPNTDRRFDKMRFKSADKKSSVFSCDPSRTNRVVNR